MENNNTKSFSILIGFFVFMGILGFLGYKFLMKQDIDTYVKNQSLGIKNTIKVGYDNYLGYSILNSKKNIEFLQQDLTKLEFIDDNGNYENRLNKLSKGELDIIVLPIHDLIETSNKINFSNFHIIGAISESKGADAIVGNISNIDNLKNKNLKLGYTSKFLLGSLAVDTNNLDLLNQTTQNNDIKDLFNDLKNKKYDVVSLWEPYVSQAKNLGYKVLLDSNEIKSSKIIDVIVVNEKYSLNNKELIDSFIVNYYKSVDYYVNNEKELRNEISNNTNLSTLDIDNSLKGIKFYEFTDNINYLFDKNLNKLSKFINAINDKLVDMNSISKSYLNVNNQIYNNYLINASNKIKDLMGKPLNINDKQYVKLSDENWNKLINNPKFKIDNLEIKFMRDMTLEESSKEILNNFMNKQLNNFDYYVAIVGKSGKVVGINEQDLIDRTTKKANEVFKYLEQNHKVQENRFKVIGLGSTQTLEKKVDENHFEYLNKNNKVELIFVDY